MGIYVIVFYGFLGRGIHSIHYILQEVHDPEKCQEHVM